MTNSTPKETVKNMKVIPIRIQRKRTKGFKLISPNGLPIVYVGRPSKWGNYFSHGKAKNLVKLYENYIQGIDLTYSGSSPPNRTEEIKKELRGKNLSCWCPLNEPCHADILLKIANLE